MDVSQVSELNAFQVRDALRTGERTRSGLAEQLGLSLPSVSRIVRRLVDAGVVEELPGTAGEAGRTAGVLRYVGGEQAAVMAVDLGGTSCHGALADLAGVVLSEHVAPTQQPGRGAHLVVADCIGVLRRRAARVGLVVRAVVVGVPAVLNPASGLASNGPNVHWEGFDVTSAVREVVAEPLDLDNDVNLAASGLAWRGEGRGVASFVTICLGTGIGAAVVIAGRVVRGHRHAAGEIGGLLVPGGGGGLAGFEATASGAGIRRRALELLASGRDSALGERGVDVGAADVFRAAAAGDALAVEIVEGTLDAVAAVVAAATALLDPERVILDGSVGRALEPWLGPLRARVSAAVFAAPDVVVSHLGPNATVIGAIARGLSLVRESEIPPSLRLPAPPLDAADPGGPADVARRLLRIP